MRPTEIRDVVKAAIDKADPINLLVVGAPENEYDPEIDEIVSRLPEWGKGVSTLEGILHTTFQRWFGHVYRGDRTYWAPIAAEMAKGLEGKVKHSDVF